MRANALADLTSQAASADGEPVSLHSMWRSSGCPAGKDPDAWLTTAGPLIEALAAYASRFGAGVERPFRYQRDGRVLDLCREQGDWMIGRKFARCYARYLDGNASEPGVVFDPSAVGG